MTFIGPIAHLKARWAQMSFIGPIAHLKAKNCPSGLKAVPPRNLIVI